MTAPAITLLLEELRRLHILDASQLRAILGQSKQFRDPRELTQELMRRGWLTSYQAGRLLQGHGPDLVLGSYLLLDTLGQGGMGQVYKARHQGMGRLVALKVIRQELASDSEIVARFYREMELTSKLEHPNLVRAFDAGPLSGTHFLTMEYVDGIDLDCLVERSGPLPVAQAIDFIRQAALGLQAIHEHGLVHRDIKPSNLLVTHARAGQPGGVIKILDLGLARLQESVHGKSTTHLPDGKSVTTLTLAGSVTLGTIDYLAPEQALDFHAADIRADIYSLGCTFYHLLVGQPPYGEGTLAVKLMRHQQAAPPDPRQLRPAVPAEVAKVILRMLSKRPADRYQTPAELAQALGPRPARRLPPLRWAAAALLLLLIGAGAVYLTPSLSQTESRWKPAGPMRNAKLRDLPDNTWLKVGPFLGKERGAWEVPWCYDPDLRRLVRVGGRVPDHSNEIWTYDLGSESWTKVLGHATDPADGRRGLANRPGYSSQRGTCFDPDRRCIWDYGGNSGGRAGSKPGLWKGVGDLTVENWTNFSGVPVTGDCRLACDEHARKLVCLGKDMSSFGRTYVFDPATSQVAEAAADPTGGRGGRVGLANFPGFLYVPELKGCLLVGSFPDKGVTQQKTVTWLFDTAALSWRDLAPAMSPPPRQGFGLSYDRRQGVVILFGGGLNGNTLADTWRYDPTHNTWAELKPAGGPQPRSRPPHTDCQMFAYDSEHNVHVLGLVDQGEDSGVWAYRYRR